MHLLMLTKASGSLSWNCREMPRLRYRMEVYRAGREFGREVSREVYRLQAMR